MTNNTLPIVISVLSFVLAAISLGWNIYRDVVLKPRARVTVAKAFVASEVLPSHDVLIISAVNLGPGKLRLNIIRFMHRTLLQRILHKWKHGVLIHDYRNRLSGQLPTTLEVGDSVDLLFPWGADLICSGSLNLPRYSGRHKGDNLFANGRSHNINHKTPLHRRFQVSSR